MEQQEADKFASELLWCINQLEQGLQTQSPSSRQAQDTMRMIKTLRSPKAPLVKKRQVMRNALGDYRKKMKEGEKKSFNAMKHSRFQDSAKCKSHLKSRFIRQSHTKQDTSVQNSEWKSLNFTLGQMSLMAEGCSTQMACSDPSVVCNNDILSGDQPTTSKSLSHEDNLVSGSDSEARVSSLDPSAEENSKFKFVPSDNSFVFSFHCNESVISDVQPANRDGFDKMLTNGPCSAILKTDEKCVEEKRAEEKTTDFAEALKKNIYHYEKSDNDFCFNFHDT